MLLCAGFLAAIAHAHRGRVDRGTRFLLVFGGLAGLFGVGFWLFFLPPLAILPAARVGLVFPLWRTDGAEPVLPPLPARGDG